MKLDVFPKASLLLILTVLSLPVFLTVYGWGWEPAVSAQTGETSGSLTVLDASGKARLNCPLQHTDVKAEISGFISRVVVTQEFANPFNERIEAVYTFPLPQNAAVDDMTMHIGSRTVKGKILPREEAQAVYEAAKSSGQIASLLDQQRPNIFTQSVANILPGERIKIQISYVETLKYQEGAYEFVFPMVVGPRYIPGLQRAPDAAHITPPSPPAGTRSGYDIALEVNLDAGLIVDNLEAKSHPVNIERPTPRSARLSLKENSTIPNKDFVLRYDVAGQAIQDALLTHRSEKGGYFTLILQPPDRVAAEDVTPKELVFVLDTSGSMQGFPIEKAKETMTLAIDNLYPSDTFNLITFSGDTHVLFPQPVAATKANVKKAQAFLATRSGSGGTEMMSAIKAALEPSKNQAHVRVVCFMTDGYVGNDMEIIAEIQKYQNARVFAFGIGSSVNRFLLDKMAEAGRGDVEYVALTDDGSAAARRFHERVRSPLLTDISIDWSGLPIADVYPQRIPDLFGARPVVVTGRFSAPARGTVKLKGKVAGNDYTREIPVELPETMALHDVLASLWARARIDHLMNEDFLGTQRGKMREDLKQTITQLGIEYRLMTQFTSFVAVEEMIVTDGGQPRRIDVPVDVPHGVNPAMGRDPSQSMNFQMARAYGLSSVPARSVSRAKVVSSGALNNSIGGGAGSGAGTGPSVPASVGLSSLEPGIEKKPQSLINLKLHPWVLQVVERVRKRQIIESAEEMKFVRNDKAELQVWLTDKSDEAYAKLKELGFEMMLDAKSSKLIIGRISIDKLEALASLSFVRYVAPQTTKP